MRVLLVTGKGGVGKTTTAAATALRLARDGHRVVVTSADPAHSLADSFDVDLGSAPTEVAPRCSAQQVDARQRFEDHWAEIRDWLLYNPVLHLVELSRVYFIPNYTALPGVTLEYPAAWALVVTALALGLYRIYRHRFLLVS